MRKSHTESPLIVNWQIFDNSTDCKAMEGTPIYYHNQEMSLNECEENARLFSASKEMFKALEFYANHDNWKEVETGIGMYPSEANTECGRRARESLAKAREGLA